MPNLSQTSILPESGQSTAAAPAPTGPNWSAGALYGPSTVASKSFPAGSYLTLAQYRQWQLEAQMESYRASMVAWDAAHAALGITAANPFTVLVANVRAEIAGK